MSTWLRRVQLTPPTVCHALSVPSLRVTCVTPQSLVTWLPPLDLAMLRAEITWSEITWHVSTPTQKVLSTLATAASCRLHSARLARRRRCCRHGSATQSRRRRRCQSCPPFTLEDRDSGEAADARLITWPADGIMQMGAHVVDGIARALSSLAEMSGDAGRLV